MKLFSFAVAGMALLSLPARAECSYPPFDFFPDKGGGVVVEMTVKAGTTCSHNFAEGPGYRFTSIGVDRAPEHGVLRKTGPFRYVYTPSGGFKGKDAYIVKICATKGAAKGCSVVAYVATVQ
jgi:hypothetical protein